jgi:hypothetical protein
VTYKPHISMLGSGTGAWGVYAPRGRPRLIGWNNTFREFRTACLHAQTISMLRRPLTPEDQMYPTNHRRP